MSKNNKYKEWFNEPPSGTKEVGILDRNTGKYGTLEDVDGEQPYYWYQGIGQTTGGTQKSSYFNVIHGNDNVIHKDDNVIAKLYEI